MESRGIDANFSFSNRFVPHSRTRTSGKQRLESRGDGEGGGWPCVGSRTAIPDMAISHNERQWCPRLETQRGRQLINSSSLVACVMQSFRGPPRLDSAPWSRLRGRLFGGLKNAEADASVDGRGGVDGGRDRFSMFREIGFGEWGNRIWGIEGGFWRCINVDLKLFSCGKFVEFKGWVFEKLDQDSGE